MLPRVPFLSNFLFIVVLVVSLSIPCRSDGFAEKEKTLAIIKPDGLYDNCTDKIKNAIFDSGFTIVKEMLIQLDEEAAMSFYAEHSSRSFFSSLVEYMTSGPVLIMVLEKENAVADWRALIGPTDASKAKITHPNRTAHNISRVGGSVDKQEKVLFLKANKFLWHGPTTWRAYIRRLSNWF
ncbi:unnamed protein product [Prunus armeniaca]|uniref:Nucleoside diphosphate kinase-like domain-containing protein n=1 Tax=Prunus armeniaca TaxID=36596 RepID=A0A6J5U7S5_PRUAR|nr:unnamed protein product [Prunus armeniaca]